MNARGTAAPPEGDDLFDPTGWPVGDLNIPYDELRQHLVRVAAQHARRAVLNRHETKLLDLLDAAVSTGTAVELIAKACVADVEPALLAAATGGALPTRSVLHLRGHGARVRDSSAVRDVTSISARHAVTLCVELHPKVTTSPRQLALVFDVRNAAAHLGLVQDDLLLAAVIEMARFVEQALTALDEDPVWFWTERIANLVRSLLDERSDQIARVVHELIAQAAQRYETTLGRLDATSRTAVVAVLEAKAEGGVKPHRCPACGHQGRALIGFEQGEEDWQWSWVTGFECPVCELELKEEMLSAAGIEMEDVFGFHFPDQ